MMCGRASSSACNDSFSHLLTFAQHAKPIKCPWYSFSQLLSIMSNFSLVWCRHSFPLPTFVLSYSLFWKTPRLNVLQLKTTTTLGHVQLHHFKYINPNIKITTEIFRRNQILPQIKTFLSITSFFSYHLWPFLTNLCCARQLRVQNTKPPSPFKTTA